MKLYGDYHTHTTYSDGKASVMEMVRAAKDAGLQEIAITDHSINKFNGLRRSNFEKLASDVESARCEMPVLLGVEADVMCVDGRIDVDAKMLEKLDIVLFGVHKFVVYSFRGFFGFFLPNMLFNLIRWVPKFQIRRNTEIVKRVIEKNNIDIWVHPNRYFKLDVLDVARLCVERKTLIELNSKKISFRQIDFERMTKMGCKFIIGSDAHTTRRIGDTTMVEEFLKTCEYNPADIINLNQTYTEYKKGKTTQNDIIEPNQNGNPEITEQPAKKRRWF